MLVTIVKDLLIDPSLLCVFVLVEDVVRRPRDAFLGVVTWTGRLGGKGSGMGCIGLLADGCFRGGGIPKENPACILSCKRGCFGGDGGIRTLDAGFARMLP